MKAARLEAPKKIALDEIRVPAISDTDVLIKVSYCGICGTDLHGFKVPGLIQVGAYIGHEFSGVITETGRDVVGWKVGDRVTVNPNYYCGECYACKHGYLQCCEHFMDHPLGASTDRNLPGAFAGYVRVPFPEKRLYALPNELSFEEGALVEPLASSLHAVRVSAFKPGDTVMVLGCGVIGLGVIAFLKSAGAGLLIATEVNRKRAEVAKTFGADFVFNPRKAQNLRDEVLGITRGLGVDQAFDCSGVPQAFRSANEFLKPRGQIVLVGVIEVPVEIVPFELQTNETQLQPSWCHIDEFPMVIQFLKRHSAPIHEMITSRIKLKDIVQQGFNKLLKPDHAEIKILVSPN